MLELLDRDVFFQTDLGRLFEGDCIQILKSLPDSSVDTVFADPPFNLKKKYGPNHSDNLSDFEYIEWCKEWIKECIRVLKPGGSFFLYNIPKWNIIFGAHIMQSGLDFRHDIAVDMKNGLPIANKLYPSHYSMLYFTKGKPKTFRKVFVPVDTCRHCSSDIKDYGGKKKFMHEEGLNLTDVWTDITVVRHKKFKTE